jgi:tetratricopeptide (TPR) repeat protein
MSVVACHTGAGTTAPPAEPPSVRRESALEESLIRLAAKAIERGELTKAEERYRRVLAASPDSTRALTGLARIAVARDRHDEARQHLAELRRRDAESADALLLLAEVERAAGRPDRTLAALRQALIRAPGRPDIHAALASQTGPAPRASVATADEAVRLAEAHPYDPAARLRAGRALLAAGEPEAARLQLVSGYWLADLDPVAAHAAIVELRKLDPAWARRHVVAVHVYADETVRREASWPMRMRLLWRGLSETLDPLLETAFVPVSMAPFRSSLHASDLDSLERAWLESASPLPREGLVAAFTERSPPRFPGSWRLGQAELLGRRILVRLETSGTASRTLVHEVMHLYGAIHIAKEVDSLMNPSGESLAVDAVNHRIVTHLRDRRFGPGGLEANVFRYVDPAPLTSAYLDMLRVDLGFRNLGMKRVTEAAKSSRYWAARMYSEVGSQDAHLADVSTFVGRLLVRQGELAQAAACFDLSASLYGRHTRRGREAEARFQSIADLLGAGDSRPTTPPDAGG